MNRITDIWERDDAPFIKKHLKKQKHSVILLLMSTKRLG